MEGVCRRDTNKKVDGLRAEQRWSPGPQADGPGRAEWVPGGPCSRGTKDRCNSARAWTRSGCSLGRAAAVQTQKNAAAALEAVETAAAKPLGVAAAQEQDLAGPRT